MKRLSDLSGSFENNETKYVAKTIMNILSEIADNTAIRDKAEKLRDINSMIFQRIRIAFMIPDHRNLSEDRYDPLKDDSIVNEKCTIVFCEHGIYMGTNIKKHMCYGFSIVQSSKTGDEKLAVNKGTFIDLVKRISYKIGEMTFHPQK
ncbi:MAG: hypothetical protein QXU18_04850 [Thermoplasmatales archaeon]